MQNQPYSRYNFLLRDMHVLYVHLCKFHFWNPWSSASSPKFGSDTSQVMKFAISGVLNKPPNLTFTTSNHLICENPLHPSTHKSGLNALPKLNGWNLRWKPHCINPPPTCPVVGELEAPLCWERIPGKRRKCLTPEPTELRAGGECFCRLVACKI